MKEVIAKAKEMGAFHQYFQYQLISYIDPFKRKGAARTSTSYSTRRPRSSRS